MKKNNNDDYEVVVVDYQEGREISIFSHLASNIDDRFGKIRFDKVKACGGNEDLITDSTILDAIYYDRRAMRAAHEVLREVSLHGGIKIKILTNAQESKITIKNKKGFTLEASAVVDDNLVEFKKLKVRLDSQAIKLDQQHFHAQGKVYGFARNSTNSTELSFFTTILNKYLSKLNVEAVECAA